ncbi:MAG: hypothetical protein ACR2OH_14560 [Microthrixaceae bacterium]
MSLESEGTTFVLQEAGTPAALGGAVAHAIRRAARSSTGPSLVLFCDSEAGSAARMARCFEIPIEVRRVEQSSSVVAVPDPLPVVPPGPDGVDELLAELADNGLEVVLEDGSYRGELLGLEVARIALWPTETGGDGRYHLEAGVGRCDRDAAAAMHEGESHSEGLARALRIVAARRHPGAGTHALSLLARARWLRADAMADPRSVGADTLAAVQTTFPPDSVREQSPAAAVGTAADGSPMVVVFGSGAGLDLIPIAADTRELQDPEARLVVAVTERDHMAVADELAARLTRPAEILEVTSGWT